MQNSDFRSSLKSLYGSQASSVILSTHNSVLSARIKRLYGFQPSPVVLCMQNGDFSTWNTSLIGPSTHLWFSYAKQRLVDQHTSLYGHQTSPVVLCIQTSVISTKFTCFYWFHPSSVVLYMKTASLGPDILVCMGARPHLWSWALITVCLEQEQKGYIGSRPHLWFLHAKQRLLVQNNKSLRFPDMTCHFVHVQERA